MLSMTANLPRVDSMQVPALLVARVVNWSSGGDDNGDERRFPEAVREGENLFGRRRRRNRPRRFRQPAASRASGTISQAPVLRGGRPGQLERLRDPRRTCRRSPRHRVAFILATLLFTPAVPASALRSQLLAQPSDGPAHRVLKSRSERLRRFPPNRRTGALLLSCIARQSAASCACLAFATLRVTPRSPKPLLERSADGMATFYPSSGSDRPQCTT